jgi:hypothetical protein
MKGFKNTTRTQYFTGGDVGGYAKGGTAKAAKPAMAKAAKPAMAKAKAPMKKSDGGNKMTASEMRAMEARFGEKKATDSRRFGVFNEGGKVRKYAEGGPAKPSFDASYHYQNLGANLKDMIDSGKLTIEQANALKAPAFEATRLRDVGQQQQAMQAALDAVYGKQPGVDNAPLVYSPIKQFDASASYQKFGADLKSMIDSGQLTIEQANALRAPAFEATRLRDPAQQESAMYAALAAARGQAPPPGVDVQMPKKTPMPPELPTAYAGERGARGVGSAPGVGVRTGVGDELEIVNVRKPPPTPTHYDRFPPPVMPLPYYPGTEPTPPMKPPLMMEEQPTPPMQKIYEPPRPAVMPPTPMPEPYYPGNDVFRPTPPTVYDNFPPAIIDRPRDPNSQQPSAPLGGISSAIRDRLIKQPLTKEPMPPMKQPMMEQPRMPEKRVAMKHGGRTAMPKGKR